VCVCVCVCVFVCVCVCVCVCVHARGMMVPPDVSSCYIALNKVQKCASICNEVLYLYDNPYACS